MGGSKKGLLSIVALFLAAAITLSCAGCTPVQRSDPEQAERKLRIGFSMATFKEDRWLQDRDIFIAKAKQAGFNVIVNNANNDSALQYEQVSEMVKKGIDVLVIVPHDSVDAARAVAVAQKAGIPVISYDRLVRDANVDVYVSFDNVKVGKEMGRVIREAVPEGGYIILNGAQNDNNSQLFNQGYMSELADAMNAGDIEVLAETWVEDWRRENAFDFVAQTLREKGDAVRAIIAANDSLAWGAIDALSVARLSDKVRVAGHDADLAACQRIVEGTQLSTVYKPIKKLVDEALRLCQMLVRGESIPFKSTINDGSQEIPYIMIDVISVNRDNMDETVIRDGFHLKEDVYRQDASAEQ